MLVSPRMAPRLAAGARPWYELRAAAADPDVAELYIYDEVAWYAVDAKRLVEDLGKVTASTIRVRINSPGGSVFDGLAIYNALRRHPARVEVRVEGLAASIASIIALAGDRVTIEPSAFLMIHDPWAVMVGNAAELRHMADTLDKVGAELRGIYARRTGRDDAELAGLMAAETWLNAAEALELGLVDEVLADPVDAQARQRFDLSGFGHPPEELVAPRAVGDSAATPSAPADRAVGDSAEPATSAPHPLNLELVRRRLALATEDPRPAH